MAHTVGMESLPTDTKSECARCRELESIIAEHRRMILDLEAKLRDLEEKLKPPPPKRPQDPQPPAPAKKPTGKTRGAQPGHPPKLRKFLPKERVSEVVQFIPQCCANCESALSSEQGPNDPEPTRHQYVELPDIRVQVIEYQGHSRTCSCGHVNHQSIPAENRNHTFGPQFTALMSYLAGSQGMSKRGIEETMESIFQVPICIGTIANLEQEMSAALQPAYAEAQRVVSEAAAKHLDETGWKERGKKRWLWVAATSLAVCFMIHARRNLDALNLLLGSKLSGILISDRWMIYDNWDGECRQVCWSHLKRNWEKKIELGGKWKEYGESWICIQNQVFELWHLFRGGGCTRADLGDRITPHVEALGALLHRGMDEDNASLASFCQRLMDKLPMMWLFTVVEGVEPTNNHAERVQRRAVLWRRKSFGCQSAAGCRFVERILTVVQTLRQQGRNAFEFLSQCLTAYRQGQPAPKLCPAMG